MKNNNKKNNEFDKSFTTIIWTYRTHCFLGFDNRTCAVMVRLSKPIYNKVLTAIDLVINLLLFFIQKNNSI